MNESTEIALSGIVTIGSIFGGGISLMMAQTFWMIILSLCFLVIGMCGFIRMLSGNLLWRDLE